MSFMKKDQNGITSFVLPFIICLVLLVGATVFAIWAYIGGHTTSSGSNQLVATAVAKAEQQTQVSDAKTYALQAQQPLQTYTGPQAYGTVLVKYPKSWSAYIIESSTSSNTPVNGYFNPGFVPDISNSANLFALRMQVIDQPYSQEMAQISQNQQQQQLTVVPVALSTNPNVVGEEFSGNIGQIDSDNNGTSGVLVAFPLRSETVEIWTESTLYTSTFLSTIVPNFSFSP
jgi:hypothetical protein